MASSDPQDSFWDPYTTERGESSGYRASRGHAHRRSNSDEATTASASVSTQRRDSAQYSLSGIDEGHDHTNDGHEEHQPDSDAPFAPPAVTTDFGSLRRELYSWHIFLITISGVIGMGFYVRTGNIFQIGGEAAVIYAFLFLGILSIMVMQGVTIMLRIWPIGAPLVVFVEKFVDEDMGKVVAILYWLTYSFSYAALATTVGTLVDNSRGPSVMISIAATFIPILANLTDIRVFRVIEVGLASLKLGIALVIIMMTNIINPTVGDSSPSADPTSQAMVIPRHNVFQHSGTGTWFIAISASIFLASFSFVGIEIVSSTAQEAKFTRRDSTLASLRLWLKNAFSRRETVGNDIAQDTIHSSETTHDPFRHAAWVPVITMALYLWGGWIVTQNVNIDDDMSSSIFIVSARKHSSALENTVHVFLILTVTSTGSTALYVASRTLFAFAYIVDKEHDSEREKKFKTLSALQKLARLLSMKSKFDVPWAAVLASSFLWWLPFFKYWLTSQDAYLTVIDFISEMASVACVMTWALVSFAAVQFYRCHRKHFRKDQDPIHVDIRHVAKTHDYGWYIGHLLISGLCACLCIAIIIVGGISNLLLNLKSPVQGVAMFVMLWIFLFLTLGLKFWNAWISREQDKRPLWRRMKFGVDLMKDEAVARRIFQSLQDQEKHHNEGLHLRKQRTWYDLFGIIDSEWCLTQIKDLVAWAKQ